jgi:hypothetical protein
MENSSFLSIIRTQESFQDCGDILTELISILKARHRNDSWSLLKSAASDNPERTRRRRQRLRRRLAFDVLQRNDHRK